MCTFVPPNKFAERFRAIWAQTMGENQTGVYRRAWRAASLYVVGADGEKENAVKSTKSPMKLKPGSVEV